MDLQALRRDLDGIRIEDNPAIVKQKSRDFFWYSPILKEQLDHITADIVVTPKSVAEVVRIVAACFRNNVPLTSRGAGTGNYGQAMPLSGGLVLNLAELNRVKSIHTGRVVAEAGAVLADIDRATRAHSGQEIRMSPSTYNTATVGGFVAGGSGGVGSIRWGGLRDLGNVISLKIVTMEAEPRILDLRGEDLLKAIHAYGTNGVITEVELPLTAAYDWIDVIVGFDDFLEAAAYGNDLGIRDGILAKLITPIAAPVPYDYFKRHQKYFRREQSIVVCMIAPQAMEAFLAFTRRAGGEIVFRADTEADLKGLPPAFELTWNHTTLRAIRVDPTITYLQTRYPFPDHLDHVRRMTEIFGDEVPGHLEFIRFDGSIGCAGLPLVRYTTRERLEEIIRIHEDDGCWIFNPHRYTLEEGGMKQTDEVQLAFKREVDPKGLLNPGKMIAWENPDYDFRSSKPFLFPRLQRAG
jgi:FAD/FMN-containing dehydrogenase